MASHSPKRILMANFSRDWGGGENWYFRVANALAEKGYPILLHTQPESALESRITESQLQKISIGATTLSLLNPIKLIRVYQEIRKFQPDIVLLNASHELKFLGLIAKWARVPHIIFRRGLSFPLKSNWINRWYFRKVVNGFLCDAQSTYDVFQQAFPVIASYPHIVIPNGIDLDKWPIPSDERIPGKIGLSARLSPEKGVDRAIHIISALKKRGISVELHILGEGLERERLEALISQHELTNEILLRGFTKHVQQELSSCQLFLFTSHGEGTSISVIEAMALGLPVVAYEAPAMNELIIDGETGYLVATDDTETAADQIQELLINETLRKKLSKQARHRVETVFSFERVVDQLADWFDHL